MVLDTNRWMPMIMHLGVLTISNTIIASIMEFLHLIDTLLWLKRFKILEDKFSTQFATGEMKAFKIGVTPSLTPGELLKILKFITQRKTNGNL